MVFIFCCILLLSILGEVITLTILFCGGWVLALFFIPNITLGLIKLFHFGVKYRVFKEKYASYNEELWKYTDFKKSEIVSLLNQLNIQKSEILSYPEQNAEFKITEILRKIAVYRDNISKMLQTSSEIIIYDNKLQIDIENHKTFYSDNDLENNLYRRKQLLLFIEEANENRKKLIQHNYEFSEYTKVQKQWYLYRESIKKIMNLEGNIPFNKPVFKNDTNLIKSIENHKKTLESTYFENEIYLQSVKNSAYKIYQNLFHSQIDKEEKEKLIQDYQSIVEKGKPYYQIIKGNMGIDYFRYHLHFSQKENALFLINFLEQLRELNKLKMSFYGMKFNQDLANEFIMYHDEVNRLYKDYLLIPQEFRGFHNNIEQHKEYAEKRILDAELYEPTIKNKTLPKKIATEEKEVNLEEVKPIIKNIQPIIENPIVSIEKSQQEEQEQKVQKNLFGEIVISSLDSKSKFKSTQKNANLEEENPNKKNTLIIQKISPSEIKISKKKERKFKGRKVNYEVKNQKALDIGLKGEILVLLHEKEILANANLPNLLEGVKHIAQIEGDGAGYDIFSFDITGSPKYIEVKTTKEGLETQFDLTDNEREFMRQNSENYYLYRVYDYDEIHNVGKCYILKGQKEFDDLFELKPKNYTAKAKKKIK
ncbi:MAG: DUF3883 domain-containing protein [Flavobacterium sp.]|jgi:hypothetical protein|nr:DUF3883 domain-containing protein [Flavobacterium sp.]